MGRIYENLFKVLKIMNGVPILFRFFLIKMSKLFTVKKVEIYVLNYNSWPQCKTIYKKAQLCLKIQSFWPNIDIAVFACFTVVFPDLYSLSSMKLPTRPSGIYFEEISC